MDMQETRGMRIAVGQFSELTDENLNFARQLGISGIQLNTPKLPGDKRWEYEDLLALKQHCEAYGLHLEALENVPLPFYNEVMVGGPRRDEQIEHYQATIRNMGRAGIPILGHHFMANFVWRTSYQTKGRGGALVSSFNLDGIDPEAIGSLGNMVTANNPALQELIRQGTERVITEAEMWENYTYFLKAVIPVAEEAGVKLALHPDDPPVRMLGGVARLFYKTDNFKRAMEIAASDAWGLDLCLGCCSEMENGAINVAEMIRHFGPLGKIFYVHFRDVQGTVPKFQECFLGEGNYNPAATMRLLKDVGFDGFILDDHVPSIVGDTPWGHRARAHAIGYMQGLIASMSA